MLLSMFLLDADISRKEKKPIDFLMRIRPLALMTKGSRTPLMAWRVKVAAAAVIRIVDLYSRYVIFTI